MKSYYETLGLSQDADEEDIKRAYRKLAMQFHPDHHQDDPLAEIRLKELNEAYEVLKNPNKRRRYDRFGAFGVGHRASTVEDFVQELVSETLKPFRNWTKSPSKKGSDLRFELDITLEECACGCEKRINYLRKKEGQDVSATLLVQIPAGINDGQRLRIQGAGDFPQSLSDSQAGDLYVIVRLQPHPLFIRSGNNVRLTLPVTLSEAALGATKTIPTLYGTKEIQISPSHFNKGAFANDALRLQGLGFTHQKSMSRGDMFVDIIVDMPQKLTSEEKKLFEQLAKVSKNYALVREFQDNVLKLKNAPDEDDFNARS